MIEPSPAALLIRRRGPQMPDRPETPRMPGFGWTAFWAGATFAVPAGFALAMVLDQLRGTWKYWILYGVVKAAGYFIMSDDRS